MSKIFRAINCISVNNGHNFFCMFNFFIADLSENILTTKISVYSIIFHYASVFSIKLLNLAAYKKIGYSYSSNTAQQGDSSQQAEAVPPPRERESPQPFPPAPPPPPSGPQEDHQQDSSQPLQEPTSATEQLLPTDTAAPIPGTCTI